MYVIALIVALLARIGLSVMGNSGVLAFNYSSATHPEIYKKPLFDQLAEALTSGSFFGFLFICGLCLALAVASVMLFSYILHTGSYEAAHPEIWACVTGALTVLVSIVCIAIIAPANFSEIQIMFMGSMGGDMSGAGGVAISLFICITTLIAAASMVFDWCISLWKKSWRRGFLSFVLATLICGMIVLLLLQNIAGILFCVSVDMAALTGALWIAIVVHIAIGAFICVLNARRNED